MAYEELASVRGVVNLSPQEALDKAEAFLSQQGYTTVRRADNSLTVQRRPPGEAVGQDALTLTLAATPQPEGGVRITVRGNDRQGVQERQTAWIEWSEAFPKMPQQDADQPENRRQGSRPRDEELQAVEPREARHLCLNCGSELSPEGANFCPRCGAAQDPTRSVGVPIGPGPQTPETGRIPTPRVPNVPPPPNSEYQRSGPGVWSGVKIFFGGASYCRCF